MPSEEALVVGQNLCDWYEAFTDFYPTIEYIDESQCSIVVWSMIMLKYQCFICIYYPNTIYGWLEFFNYEGFLTISLKIVCFS